MTDNIIKDVWKAKDTIAAECDYNPEKLANKLKTSKYSRGEKTVDYHDTRVKSNQAAY